MGKRKQAAPQQKSEEKRKCLSWNMLDGVPEPSSNFSVISDSDPLLLQEINDSEELKKSENHGQAQTDEEATNFASSSNTNLTEIFELYLEASSFYISIFDQPQLKKNEWTCVIGQFQIRLLPEFSCLPAPSRSLPECDECWFYVSDEPGKSMLYYELIENDENSTKVKNSKKNSLFWFAESDLPFACMEALQCKAFQVVIGNYFPEAHTVEVKIVARESVLSKLQCASEGCRPKKINQCLMVLVGHFYEIFVPNYNDLPYNKKHNIDAVYEEVKQHHQAERRACTVDVQHPLLIPCLRPYQKSAIQWMLEKERFNSPPVEFNEGDVHQLYQKIITVDQQTLYYNKHAGLLVEDLPKPVTSPPGGILADEMGLGKTVEVLACMILHPRIDVPSPEVLPPWKEKDAIDPEIDCDEASCSSESTINYSLQHVSLEETGQNDSSAAENSSLAADDSSMAADNSRMAADDSNMSTETGSTMSYKYSGDIESENSQLSRERSLNQQNSTESQDTSSGKTTDYTQTAFESGASVSDTSDNKTKSKRKSSRLSSTSSQSESNNNKKPKKAPIKTETTVTAGLASDQPKNAFSAIHVRPKNFFECICGAEDSTHHLKKYRNKHRVQCVKCGLWQHAECVSYDVSDPYRGEFKCPHCHVSSVPIPSGATLIISPYSICDQWVDEILKHIRKESLNVFVYTGVNKQGFIQPRTLAKQDIVITTYETLRKEIDYVDLPHSNCETGRKLRHPKRFMAIPSPITAVEWWRICLDEAQMVECTTTKTAAMALRLSAVNRWCVTGTPIQKGLEDLYGLLLFLGVDPYWVQQWWRTLVFDPFCHGVREPMHDLVSSVLWRSAKKDVLDQINIPKQTEEIHWLTFSPVEEHFYRRQYGDCVRISTERLRKFTDTSRKLSSLDRYTMNQLLHPLLRLRQACCHPQAVRGEFLPIHKSTMSMEELLESLTKKAKLECEESHRQLVAAINGEAGLYIIKEEYVTAVEKYRDVLRSIEEHRDQLKTDELQRLHAMHNLHEILSLKPQGVDPTLRDGQLTQQAAEIRDKYMAKAAAKVVSTVETLNPIQQNILELDREFSDNPDWWVEVIFWSTSLNLDEQLVQKIREDLQDNRNPELNSIVRSFRNVKGLEYVIETNLSTMVEARNNLLVALNDLSGKPTQEDINKTVECCLRPVDNKILRSCSFCLADELFNAYENRLFSFVDKGVTVAGDEDDPFYTAQSRRKGTWADSEIERALKSIISFAKAFRDTHSLLEFGSIHMKLFEAWKKEFKHLRLWWMSMREQVSAVDELDMATTRLRLRYPDEPVPETPEQKQVNVLEPTELDQHRLKLASDRIIAQNELRKKLGQLLYLKNLAKTQTETEDGSNPEPCPVCQRELGKEWSVLQCGHCYCLDCIRILLDRCSFGGHNKTLKCPVCRQSVYHSDISYVLTKKDRTTEEKDDNMKVRGSHSTKVEAVVKCLMKIKCEDPKAKVLVFSTWVDVLNVISRALSDNNIKYRALYVTGKFQHNLTAFKHEDDVTVLLLPIHSGANGLNLIEATYVLLVEPILNTAQELQAIGRVHRIGQTRPTCVHRFLIRGTIEQKINTMLKSMDMKTSVLEKEENNLTIGDLTSLFQRREDLEEDNVDTGEQVGGGDRALAGTSEHDNRGDNSDTFGRGDHSHSPVPSTSRACYDKQVDRMEDLPVTHEVSSECRFKPDTTSENDSVVSVRGVTEVSDLSQWNMDVSSQETVQQGISSDTSSQNVSVAAVRTVGEPGSSQGPRASSSQISSSQEFGDSGTSQSVSVTSIGGMVEIGDQNDEMECLDYRQGLGGQPEVIDVDAEDEGKEMGEQDDVDEEDDSGGERSNQEDCWENDSDYDYYGLWRSDSDNESNFSGNDSDEENTEGNSDNENREYERPGIREKDESKMDPNWYGVLVNSASGTSQETSVVEEVQVDSVVDLGGTKQEVIVIGEDAGQQYDDGSAKNEQDLIVVEDSVIGEKIVGLGGTADQQIIQIEDDCAEEEDVICVDETH